MCTRVKTPYIGNFMPPLIGNSYNEIYKPLLYMVDDHPYHRKTMGEGRPDRTFVVSSICPHEKEVPCPHKVGPLPVISGVITQVTHL